MSPLLTVLCATGFTFSMTAVGSAMVFFFRQEIPDKLQRAFLGFAAGVMIAASVWSLLIPSIERAAELGLISWIPASLGFLLGALFLLVLERLMPHLAGDKIQ